MNSGVENTTRRPAERPLSHFSVELEVYSGPYEGLLALILRDEVEIFEVPLREIVTLYTDARPPKEDPNTLERDTDFVDSAASLVLLKGRALAPAIDLDGDEAAADPLSPEELEERLVNYLKVRHAAEELRRRLAENARFYPSAHAPPSRPGRLSIHRDRLVTAARRTFSRAAEPETRHLGPITVTVEDLVTLIRSSLARGPVSFEDLVRGMDRLRSAVAFAAALSMAAEGDVTLHQTEPFGPMTLDPTR